MMIIYWILGIALVVWVVRKFVPKKGEPQDKVSGEAPGTKNVHHKKDDTCCHP